MEKKRENQRFFALGRRHVVVFAALFALFGVVQWSPTFEDPDSFYHLGMAVRLAHGELVRNFTWLPFTTLAHAYADHHLLYHLLLVPFVAFGDPFVGAKIATALFAAAAIVVFMRVLELQRIRWPWAYALMLATSASFMFRLNLTKATAPALVLFLLAVHFAWARRARPLAIVAFLHVWMHGSWPALIGVGIAAYVADVLARRASGVSFGEALRNADRRPFAALLIGLAAGIVVNPYFPVNLAFYAEQIVQVAVIGHASSVAVGSEWYGYAPSALFAESSIVFLLLGAVLALLVVGIIGEEGAFDRTPIKEGRMRFIVLTGLLTFAFLVLTLRSRRHVEYLVPFFMAFDAAVLDTLFRRMDPTALLRTVDRSLGMRHAGSTLIVAAAAVVALLATRSTVDVVALQHDGIRRDAMAAATAWLDAHTDDGEVVLHAEWDAFPMLWYHGPNDRYIAGLDPMFLYRADPDAYAAWHGLTEGERDAVPVMARFGARYLLVEKRKNTEALHEAADADAALRQVYEDEDVRIYSRI